MSIKELIVGSVITVAIGGTAYTVSQADVAKNFAADTGMSQQQAEEYVSGISKDDLVSFSKLGTDYISDGQLVLTSLNQIDCDAYEYEWESSALSCETAKGQLEETGNDEISLGHAFQALDSESASKPDISAAINLIDEVNRDYEFSIVTKFLDPAAVSDAKKANSYNKAVLKTALEKN